MTTHRPTVDPDGLLEYSVVYTDRALNHMSERFQSVLKDISAMLKTVYGAASAVIVPGNGTAGMEAVARQFAANEQCLVIRNGMFSYRWTQILEAGTITTNSTVLKARSTSEGAQAPFAPPPIEEVVSHIRSERPGLVFAPHVETSAGMVLPEDYLREMADAVHERGGLFVLDCIASGTHWVDMENTGVDVLISAPQKSWSSTPCCGLVMLSGAARERIESTRSSSFALDLRQWLDIMETYENGSHAYYATMPTDGLAQLREAMIETRDTGFDVARERQFELGRRVRALLEEHGFPSVAAEGYQASSVVVSHTTDADIKSGRKFADMGVQIAAGVPLHCGEGDDFQTFRIGLFGLDKLADVDQSVERLEEAVSKISS